MYKKVNIVIILPKCCLKMPQRVESSIESRINNKTEVNLRPPMIVFFFFLINAHAKLKSVHVKTHDRGTIIYVYINL